MLGSNDLCWNEASCLLNLWPHQGLVFACVQLLLSSNSVGNLNGLSRPEWGQQDEVMSRHSLTWSRLKQRMKISCCTIVSALRASQVIDGTFMEVPHSQFSFPVKHFLCYLSTRNHSQFTVFIKICFTEWLKTVVMERHASCELAVVRYLLGQCPGAQRKEVNCSKDQRHTI